jgi:hypothetical protein
MACGSGETSQVPNDFKLSAHYSPGYSNWKPWKTVITADGKVSQEIQVARSGKEGSSQKTSVLTTNDFQQLFAAVRASEFSTLKTKYYYPITDNPTLTLQLTMNGSSHEVNVYAPHHLKDNQEVKRFLRVWNEEPFPQKSGHRFLGLRERQHGPRTATGRAAAPKALH